MIITNIIIDFELPFVFSLKERRKVINSIKDKLKKFNLSIIDISSEYPKEATIAICYLSHNQLEATKYKEKIENFLFRNFPEYEFYFDIEYI